MCRPRHRPRIRSHRPTPLLLRSFREITEMNAAADMTITRDTTDSARYARCIKASKRVRWDIDADVLRGRQFDFSQKFLPEGLSQVDRLGFLTNDERRTLSQVQGRTYAYISGSSSAISARRSSSSRGRTCSPTRLRSRVSCA